VRNSGNGALRGGWRNGRITKSFGGCSTQRHRGPDGEGVHADGPVVLGHRRLSIIDLSEAATQPMSNEDGTIWATSTARSTTTASWRRTPPGGASLSQPVGYGDSAACYEEWGMQGMLRGCEGCSPSGFTMRRPSGLVRTSALPGTRPRRHQACLLRGTGGKPLVASEVGALRRAMACPVRISAQSPDFSAWVDTSPRTYLESVRCLPTGAFMAIGSGASGYSILEPRIFLR